MPESIGEDSKQTDNAVSFWSSAPKGKKEKIYFIRSFGIMKTAVIYARYSCDKQTEQSIEGQLRVCQDYAKNHDILILDTYIDQAISGTTDNRADFQRMIKDSARKEWDFVLVYKLDRFSRDKYATAIHKRLCAITA